MLVHADSLPFQKPINAKSETVNTKHPKRINSMKHQTIILSFLFLQTITLLGQVGAIDTLPVYKIIPDTLTIGERDSNGYRQGTHYQYNVNGTINFIRTYKNDTLNGFLGCYSPKGFVNSEQFYKNGQMDSLWFDYAEGNILEEKGYYKNGLKHGIFLKFYKDGNLKYEGYYQNDTLVGLEIHYYDNKQISAIGNKKNGEYKTFYKNGKISDIFYYENYHVSRHLHYFIDSLKNEPPKHILPKPLNGSNIVNKTKLKVDELYSNVTGSVNSMDFVTDAAICLDDSLLTIRFYSDIFVVKGDGLHYCSGCINYDSENQLAYNSYGTNMELFTNENNEEDVRYFERDEKIANSSYNITVHRNQLQCQDTGNNPMTIEFQGKTLELKDLKNVQIFEYDANRDGVNELYIISYQSCLGLVKILRVMK